MSGVLPPHVAAAFIEAGGCKCTPQPWLACDVCRRPISPWALTVPAVTAFDWQGILIEGQQVEKRDLLSMDNVPKDRLVELKVATTSPRAPVITARVDPRKGEKIFMFTRRARRVSVQGNGAGGVDVVVLEVMPDPNQPDLKVRLYVHPQRGLILSTEDLWF